MATYLLKASDEKMQEWRDAAKAEGFSFAEWVRAKLDGRPPAHRVIASRLEGKRSYKPDPKPGPKKQKPPPPDNPGKR